VIKRYEDCYKWDKRFKPIVTLAKQLAKSSYAKDIYPITSMNTIIISQTPEFDMHREVLAIDYNFEKEYFTLKFREHLDPKKRSWTKYCPPEEVYSGVVHFFCLQKWFTEFPE
jgi:hypothetical protein